MKFTVQKTLAERLWEKVDKTSSPKGCWLFVGKINDQGYGQLSYQVATGVRTYKRAHRVSYEAMVGPIPEGLQLDHLCRVRHCVNPAHLEAVTSQINMLRGNAPSCVAARTNFCPRGHEFTPENTYIRPDGSRRICRTCRQARDAKRRRQQKRTAA